MLYCVETIKATANEQNLKIEQNHDLIPNSNIQTMSQHWFNSVVRRAILLLKW